MSRRSRSLSNPVTMRPFPAFVDVLAATLLVLVFIITLLSIFSGKVLDEMEGRQKAREAQSRLDDDLAAVVAQDGVRIEREGTQLRILLPEQVLFDSGEALLRPAWRALLDRVGRHLRQLTSGSIVVEGHTDDRGIGDKLASQYETNWELSSTRATRVVRRLVDVSGLLPDRMTASGLASTRPIQPNDTPEGRAANRRIEIRVQP